LIKTAEAAIKLLISESKLNLRSNIN